MADVVIENLITKLSGDGGSYYQMLQEADRRSTKSAQLMEQVAYASEVARTRMQLQGREVSQLAGEMDKLNTKLSKTREAIGLVTSSFGTSGYSNSFASNLQGLGIDTVGIGKRASAFGSAVRNTALGAGAGLLSTMIGGAGGNAALYTAYQQKDNILKAAERFREWVIPIQASRDLQEKTDRMVRTSDATASARKLIGNLVSVDDETRSEFDRQVSGMREGLRDELTEDINNRGGRGANKRHFGFDWITQGRGMPKEMSFKERKEREDANAGLVTRYAANLGKKMGYYADLAYPDQRESPEGINATRGRLGANNRAYNEQKAAAEDQRESVEGELRSLKRGGRRGRQDYLDSRDDDALHASIKDNDEADYLVDQQRKTRSGRRSVATEEGLQDAIDQRNAMGQSRQIDRSLSEAVARSEIRRNNQQTRERLNMGIGNSDMQNAFYKAGVETREFGRRHGDDIHPYLKPLLMNDVQKMFTDRNMMNVEGNHLQKLQGIHENLKDTMDLKRMQNKGISHAEIRLQLEKAKSSVDPKERDKIERQLLELDQMEAAEAFEQRNKFAPGNRILTGEEQYNQSRQDARSSYNRDMGQRRSDYARSKTNAQRDYAHFHRRAKHPFNKSRYDRGLAGQRDTRIRRNMGNEDLAMEGMLWMANRMNFGLEPALVRRDWKYQADAKEHERELEEGPRESTVNAEGAAKYRRVQDFQRKQRETQNARIGGSNPDLLVAQLKMLSDILRVNKDTAKNTGKTADAINGSVGIDF